MNESINQNHNSIFAKGSKVVSDTFTGEVWREVLLSDETTLKSRLGNITFEPGARNNWHMHPGGQILLITGGKGYYQEEGKPAQLISAGDVINIPPLVKHWHGATPENLLEHIAIVVNTQKGDTLWLDPVTDEEYDNIKI